MTENVQSRNYLQRIRKLYDGQKSVIKAKFYNRVSHYPNVYCIIFMTGKFWI